MVPFPQTPPRGAKTLNTGLRLLWELQQRPDGPTHTELAQRLDIERTAVYRMLGTLQAQRMVTKTESGRYYLGLGLVELARAVQPQLREAASLELRSLADSCGATAFVTSLDGDDEAVVIAVEEPSRTIAHVAYRVGFRHSATRGASGIAILAGRPARPGERTEITEARRNGYSVTSGELQAGAWGLAAPITPGDAPAQASVGIVSIGELGEGDMLPRVLATASSIAHTLPQPLPR